MTHAPPPAPARLGFVWALAVCGGVAAMAHQLLWTRRLIDLTGAGHEATARVFGVFFLGIALGSAAAAVLMPKLRRPWVFLGIMELGIGALALPIALLPAWTGGLWPALGPEALTGSAGGWVKLGVSILCLLPPSFCMGFFVPVVAREISPEGRLGGRVLVLYAANTVGGVAGLALTALWGIHALGLQTAMFAASALNGIVAVGCLALARQPGRMRDVAKAGPLPGPARGGIIGCAVLAAFSGASVLALEILLIQQLQLVVPTSFYAPAAMLAVIILALAVASALAATPWVRRLRPVHATVGALAVAAVLLSVSPWLLQNLAVRAPALSTAGSLSGFLVKITLLIAISFGPALVIAGLVFPLVSLWLGDPRRWGWLLAWNGLGALAGAEFTYRVLLPVAGLHGGYAAVALSYGVAAIAVAVRAGGRGGWIATGTATAAAAVLAWALLPRLPLVNPHVGFTVVETLSGREGIVSVVDHPRIGRGILLSNQYLLGSTGSRWDMERQAHLPLLLHPAPERVAFLGVATGTTPAAGLAHRAVGELTAVEISPLVVAAAERHFASSSAALFDDPRARIAVEDGRTWFAACEDRYEVIAGDLFQPWGPGEGRLFSREHFSAIRGALTDGGLFCQWLPGHQLTAGEFQLILDTFAGVFGEVEVFTGGFSPMAPSIALVGWKNGGLDWRSVEDRCLAERSAGGLRDPVARHAGGLRLLHLFRHRPSATASPLLNTLDNCLLELASGVRQVRGEGSKGTLAGARWIEWMAERTDRDSPGAALHLAEAMAFRNRLPLARDPAAAGIWRKVPEEIRDDPGADWNRWPGSLRPR